MEKQSKILFVDDSLDDIELTLTAFKECNLSERVDIVCDGKEAIDYLLFRGQYANRKKTAPVIILLDLKMQRLDGREVLKIIRKSKEYSCLPIVILSSSRMETDIAQSYYYGANAYIIKPVDYKELVRVIRGIWYFWSELNTVPGM